jgi:CRISPR-associated protein Csb2
VIALRIDFLAGRFHATPWNRAVNDGDVEWPPEPWRLLRALVAASYRIETCDERLFIALLDKLAEPPSFRLLPVGDGHTRHYMPAIEGANEKRVLIFDSFVALESGNNRVASAYVVYANAHLQDDERRLLAMLCERIGYLGRAESWCSLEIVEEFPQDSRLAVVDLASRTEDGGRIVRRLAPQSGLRGIGLLRSLRETTGEMRKAKRLLPKGTEWVEYRFPPTYGLAMPAGRDDGVREGFGPCILRFALQGEEVDLLPSRYDTVAVAEAMRGAVMKAYSSRQGEATTPNLAGKSIDGNKGEGHAHVYYLPRDTKQSGNIDTIDLWFPSECRHEEYRAATCVTKLYDPWVLQAGYAVTFLGIAEVEKSSVWQTETPLVADRFPKHGDSIEDQIRRALERRRLPTPMVTVWQRRELIEVRGGRRLRTDAFRKQRRGRIEPRPLIAATLHFDRVVQGPIVLGRLAHFGLGQFAPAG